MWKLAWDFVLSLALRAVFTLALVGGAIFLDWAWRAWRTGHWKDDSHLAPLAFVLAGTATLVGLLGTFRRGRAEANFSLPAVAGIVAGAGLGHVHAPVAHGRGRTLRRFPSLESFILGELQIALWAGVALWKEELRPLRIGALLGGLQILWGLAVERFGGAR